MVPDLDREAVAGMLARIRDTAVPDGALSPVEQAARAWRREAVDDLGGLEALTATRHALLDVVVGSRLLLHALDREVFELAERQGLVDPDRKAVRQVVLDRMRVADSLTKQLVALGLEKKARKAVSLGEYLASKQQATPPGSGDPPDGAEANHGELGCGKPRLAASPGQRLHRRCQGEAGS